MIRCFILDDELPAIKVLKRYIKKMPQVVLIGYATNPLEGMARILQEKPDLVFLDIQMDDMNGIDVMRIIRQQTKVVFCTAYTEYAVTSYELEAVDYLLKPIEFDRFVKAVQRVESLLQQEEPVAQRGDYIYVKRGLRGKFLKVDFAAIDYVQASGNYVRIYKDDKYVLSYHSLKEMDERLPDDSFMRIHKSFIVALAQIQEIEYNEVILKSQRRLPVGIRFRELFLKRLHANEVKRKVQEGY